MSAANSRAVPGPKPGRILRRTALGLVLVLCVGSLLVDSPLSEPARSGVPSVDRVASPWGHEGLSDSAPEPGLCDEPLDLVLPSGAPPALSCDEARRIVAQARRGLASPGRRIHPQSFAEATTDWLDPHGLWSAAPDTPTAAVLREVSRTLLSEVEALPGSGPCTAATTVASAMVPWIDHLREIYTDAFERASTDFAAAKSVMTADTPFEDGELTRTGPELASELGRTAGAIRARFGPSVDAYVRAALERTVPRLDPEQWAEVVLAAAVRAYVPLLDAHGAWAPLDEETSIYDFDLLPGPPPRLWGQMSRSAVGIRILVDPLPPLQVDDLVVRVHGTALAGMSVEQSEQFAVLSQPGARGAVDVVVLRSSSDAPLALTIVPEASRPPARERSEDDSEWPPGLWLEDVPYGAGVAAVIHVPDVPDDLGVQLASAIAHAERQYELEGIVLDVRDNGGGSTDGAIDALSLFVPGAAMFPMRRRDGGIEIERTANLPVSERYTGPVAVMIDGNSASAAEMIAGAIQSYDRGILAGARSYGKGCAQEYLDDDARIGVLRLTTLLYALPDGSPVQRVGVHPDLALRVPTALEREASIPHALAPWRGPDVRDGPPVPNTPWPRHAGHVGPCSDEAVCRTLRAIGSSAAASR